MNKLEAVNVLLRKIRERSVSSLTEPLNHDARTAVEVLDRTSTQVQLRGWTFNTERKFTLERDETNQLVLPTNTLRVIADERYREKDQNLVQRGNRLYDPRNRTYEFDDDVVVEKLVVELDWDDLPVVAQFYIAAAAAIPFIETSHGDSGTLATARLEEQTARLEMLRMYAVDAKVNLLDGPDTVGIANRRRIPRG